MTSTNTSNARAISSGLKWMYLSTVLQALLKVVVLAALTRLLLPHDFGLLGIALIFTSCAERIGQIGIGPAVIQRDTLTPEDLGAAWVLSIAFGFLTALALALAAPYVGEFFNEPGVVPVLRILAAGFIIDGFAVVPDCMLHRGLKFKQIMVSENIAYVAGNAGVGIALAYLGFGVWSLALSNIAMRVVRLAMMLSVAERAACRRPTLATCRGLIDRGVGFSLGRILNFLALQGDNFVVGRLLGADMLGMYTRAYQLMTLPATYLGQVLERVLFPAMSRTQQDHEKLKAIFISSLELLTIAALPASAAMYALSPEIIGTLFGLRWGPIVPVLEILSLGVFFRTAYKSSDTLMRSLGAVYVHASRQLVYTILVLVGAWLGSAWWGLEGVACGVVFAVFVNYVLMTRLSATSLGLTLSEVVRPHLPGVWLSVWVWASLAVSMPFVRSTFATPVLRLAIATIISAVVSAVALALAPKGARSSVLAAAVGHLPFASRGPVRAVTQIVLGRPAES